MLNRRAVLAHGAAFGGLAGLSSMLPAWARSGSRGVLPTLPTLSGRDIALEIGHTSFTTGGRTGRAISINGTIPAPLLRLREGETCRIAVTNTLEEDTSIHWHGFLIPFQMDGVPGVSFPGIRPRETFVYELPIRQSGTFWYHSHSGLQEQVGHYGPIIIDPATPDPVAYDREHVLVLSDWSFMAPEQIIVQLKQEQGHFNRNNLTVAGLFSGDPAQNMSIEERVKWTKMRMDPTDISDVTGAIYTYLVNGHGPAENWTGLFRPGERVRLRVINASAMTVFQVRIPGLKMTVVSADGENVRPVAVDEFQISVAETYDVIVQPKEDRAYTVVSEAVDRSGMGRATLAPRMGMSAAVPPLRPRPILGMDDMGMPDMGGMGSGGTSGMNHGSAGGGSMAGMGHGATGGGGSMSGMNQAAMRARGSMSATSGGAMRGGGGSMAGMSSGGMGAGSMAGMSGSGPKGGGGAMTGMGGGMDMNMRDPANVPPNVEVGPGMDMIAPDPQDRTGHPGLGLKDVGHKVLTYRDLVSLKPNRDRRRPTRTLEINLTGNMNRFMWSLDGRKFSDGVEPIRFARNERVRVTMVNNSMMQHPMHIHGHFMELVNGHPGHHPLKHTINVLPGSKVTFDITADNPGDWAFHCHLLLHMHAGMFNVVTVRPLDREPA
ncbi:copper resistance system multicopper oxidase [Methylobacterium aquaticum]|jgi:CopA family copper-resistance protein|uniref:Copper-binding protein n=1 Tax=Methylobacterium aquaticum TaxID=270351 RepID=A0A0J6SIW9_9HYPH|nr:copper resistance system multicopper oxidase [Methylobacterium aquaticum]KMO33358.1 copper-binding protein [Methylobacterium aquaticum]